MLQTATSIGSETGQDSEAGKAGDVGMSDTQQLLGKIVALRQRLEQAKDLVPEAAAAAEADSLQALADRVAAGARQDALLDAALRPLTRPVEADRLPNQLTARARYLVERAAGLLQRLRGLADQLDQTPPMGAESDADPGPDRDPMADPVAAWYRDTVGMTETGLRLLSGLPDSAGAQLRLCQGIAAILDVADQRVQGIAAALTRRKQDDDRLETTAHLLTELLRPTPPDAAALTRLAEELLDESRQAVALRWLSADPKQPARFVAGHALMTAQVIARITRHDAEWKDRPLDPILAALVHDAGMLTIPADLLAHPGPLTDEQRRTIEGHVHDGAAGVARGFPGAPRLVEAAAKHHERLDGTGYPGGLRADQISPLARLLAVCDVYAALCSPRPYRAAKDPRTALTDTLLLAEKGLLDRFQAERLLRLSFYPVGSVVELADGAIGVVVATPPPARRDLRLPFRPVVALVTDSQGEFLPAPRHVDLAQAEDRSILRALPISERRRLLGRRYPELAA